MIRKLLGAVLATATLAAGPAAAEKVVVNYPGESYAFAPFFVAMALGAFERVGLEVELVKGGSGTQALAAVVGGDVDISMNGVAPTLAAKAEGADVVPFAAATTQYTTSVTISREWAEQHNVTEDSPLEAKYKALEGARIGVSQPGSGSDQLVRFLATKGGLDPDRDLEIIGIGSSQSTTLAALQNDKVDGVANSSPAPELARRDFGAVILFNNNEGVVEELDGFFFIAAVARNEWLRENPETAAKFAAGLQLGLDAIRNAELREQARDAVVGEMMPEMSDEIASALWDQLDDIAAPSVEINDAMVSRAMSFYNNFSKVKLDETTISEFYTNEYAARGAEMVRSGAVEY